MKTENPIDALFREELSSFSSKASPVAKASSLTSIPKNAYVKFGILSSNMFTNIIVFSVLCTGVYGGYSYFSKENISPSKENISVISHSNETTQQPQITNIQTENIGEEAELEQSNFSNTEIKQTKANEEKIIVKETKVAKQVNTQSTEMEAESVISNQKETTEEIQKIQNQTSTTNISKAPVETEATKVVYVKPKAVEIVDTVVYVVKKTKKRNNKD